MVTVPFSRKLRPIFTAMIRMPTNGPMINPPRITGRSEKSIFTNPGASGTGNSMAIKTALTAPIKALKTRGLTAIFPALFVAAVFPAHTSRAALRHVRFILTPPSFLTPGPSHTTKRPGVSSPGPECRPIRRLRFSAWPDIHAQRCGIDCRFSSFPIRTIPSVPESHRINRSHWPPLVDCHHRSGISPAPKRLFYII